MDRDKNGQDCRMVFLGLNWGCLDRIAGLQDLQDRMMVLTGG